MSGTLFPGVPVINAAPDRGGSDPDQSPDFLLPLPAQWPRNKHSEAYVKSMLVVSGPARLFHVTCYDANASGEFVQLFDSSVLPAEGAVPALFETTGTAAGNLIIDFGTVGRWFYRGIYIVASSTGPTKTLAATANLYCDVQYA